MAWPLPPGGGDLRGIYMKLSLTIGTISIHRAFFAIISGA